MRETGRKFAERGKPILLLLNRVASRIRSDIRPTRRVASSGILCTNCGNSEAGKSQDAALGFGTPAQSEILHSGKRQNSGNFAGLDRENEAFAANLPAPLELSSRSTNIASAGSPSRA